MRDALKNKEEGLRLILGLPFSGVNRIITSGQMGLDRICTF